MADDPVTAELATIREDFRVTADLERLGGYKTHTAALRHGTVLLAVVEVVLALHRPDGYTQTIGPCSSHEQRATSRVTRDLEAMRACPRCVVVEHVRCWQSGCPDEWPCPTYLAIQSALTGEAGEHG